MSTGPIIGLALGVAVIVSTMLPASSSYALTYPNRAQNCASTGQLPTEGVGNCKDNKERRGTHDRAASAGHSLSGGRGGHRR
jgi:hypothetical protein